MTLLMIVWVSTPLWMIGIVWWFDRWTEVRSERRRARALVGTMGERNG